MDNLFHSLPLGDNFPEVINVVIEVPAGSPIKYQYDDKLGIMSVDRILHAPMPMPINYGFIPQCWNPDDNDPADALVLASFPIQSGILCESRPIGYFSMIDTGEIDDKVVCVPADDPHMAHIQDVHDLPVHLKKQLEFYFAEYKTIKGKKVEVKGFSEKANAIAHIKHGAEEYKKKFSTQ